MIIRISPQWQLSIPKAIRPHLGATKQLEARMEDNVLMLRPVLAASVEGLVEALAPEGMTREVLYEAMRLIEARRRKAVGAP